MGTVASTTFDGNGHTWTYRLNAEGYSGSVEPLKILTQPVRRVGRTSPSTIMEPLLPTRLKFTIRDTTGTISDLLQQESVPAFTLVVDRNGSRWYEGNVIWKPRVFDPTRETRQLVVEASDLPKSLQQVPWDDLYGRWAQVTGALRIALNQVGHDLPMTVLYRWQAADQVSPSTTYPSSAQQVRLDDVAEEADHVRAALADLMRWGAMQLMQYDGRWHCLQRSERRRDPAPVLDVALDQTRSERDADIHRTLTDADILKRKKGTGQSGVSPMEYLRITPPAHHTAAVRQQPVIDNPAFEEWNGPTPVGWDVENPDDVQRVSSRQDRVEIVGNGSVRQPLNQYLNTNETVFRIAGIVEDSNVEIAQIRLFRWGGETFWLADDGTLSSTPEAITVSSTGNIERIIEPDWPNIQAQGLWDIELVYGGAGAFDVDYAGPWTPSTDGEGQPYEPSVNTPSATVYPYSGRLSTPSEEQVMETALTMASDITPRIRAETPSSTPDFDRVFDWAGPGWQEQSPDVSGHYLMSFIDPRLNLRWPMRRAAEGLRQQGSALRGLDFWVDEAPATPRDIIHTLHYDGASYVPVYVEDYTLEPVKRIIAYELRWEDSSTAVSDAEMSSW